jgi:uncharacterized protein YdeI (YjbR/CyaY-like superfamily)
MNPKVHLYFDNLEKWKPELEKLRMIILDCMLTEELKWGSPCYSFQKKNVILLGGFKDNCVISFIKGVLLSDPKGILIKPGENSQSARVIRFTNLKEIIKLEPVIKSYIFETIENEKAGIKVELKKTTEYEFPEELEIKFKASAALKKAFHALTPGRQRGYLLFFTAAKQSETRTARIEKYTDRILKGIGINDCVCGLSKKMPSCDGSHKSIQ